MKSNNDNNKIIANNKGNNSADDNKTNDNDNNNDKRMTATKVKQTDMKKTATSTITKVSMIMTIVRW